MGPPLPDSRIDPDNIPGHIAVIMDGNGRWAQLHGKTRAQGHEAGARNVRDVIDACRLLGARALTLYAFSTENWRRSKREVDSLFRLMSRYMRRYSRELKKTDIRLRFMGRLEGLPEEAARDVMECVELTRNNRLMDVCIALNYGGRAELADAARQIAALAASGAIRAEQVDETMLARHLYIPEHAEVDLLIRTSGEMRISNFLLWQLSYSEIVVSPVLWPDFGPHCLFDAVVEYQARKRRYGGRP